MSNLSTRPLRITYDDLQVPSADCNDSGVDLAKRNQADNCHVLVNITDGKESRLVRFDRKVDRFLLSVKQGTGQREYFNTVENIDWFVQHSETVPQLLNIISIMGTTLSSAGIRQDLPSDPRERARTDPAQLRSKHADLARIPLLIANYIVTGQVMVPGDPKPQTLDDLTMNLLDVFANSDPTSVQDFIGKIAYFKADSNLDDQARTRAAYVDSILNRVPNYNKFLKKLIPEEVQADLDLEDANTSQKLKDLQSFVARAIIDLGAGKYFKYDDVTYRAHQAYESLVGEKNRKKDFCLALKHADDAVTGRKSRLGEHFEEECRAGLKLSQMQPKEAAKESIQHYLNSSRGRKDLEATILTEVRKSHMDPDWLAKRGQIGKVTQLLLNHTQVKIKYERAGREKEGPLPPGAPEPKKKIKSIEIHVDAAALKTSLNMLIQSERAGKHREPVIAALGVLRLVFGKNARNQNIAILADGEYQDVPLVYSRDEIKSAIRMVESDLKTSFRLTEVAWPIAQGVSSGLGLTAIGLGLGLKNAPTSARQGLFIGGCAVAGFGLGSLVNLSKSKRVKNKHKWGAVGGFVGMAVLGGACTAISVSTGFLKNGSGGPGPDDMEDPTRFPVDEYGP